MSNKLDKHSAKYKVSQSTADGLVYIKQMIKNNINSFFEFTPIHPDTLYHITTLTDDQIKQYLHKLKFIAESPQPLTIRSAKEFISFFLCLILHFFSKEDITFSFKYIQVLFEGVLKLYTSELLAVEELLILALFLVVLSIEPRRELFCKSIKDMSFTDISNKRIKNADIFYLSMDLVIKANNQYVTSTYCEFCLSKVVKNKTNLFSITKEAKILSLLQITASDKQIEFLSKIYMSKYSKTFLSFFLKNIRIALESPNETIKETLPVLKNQTDFLSQINREEIDNLDIDPLPINKGFVMNNTPLNGLFVNNIKIKNQFTLLFSFNFSPNANYFGDDDYPILLLKAETDTEQIISFYIHKGEFILSALDYKNKTICEIRMNTTYYVYFQLKDQFILSIKSQEHQWVHKNAIKTHLKKEFTMEIGKDNKNNFEGYIGSVLMFKTIFPDDFRFSCFALKGNYDSIYYLPLYETSHIDKYNKEVNNISEENAEYHNALKYFRTNKETIKNLICFIAPPNGNELEKKNKKLFSHVYFKDLIVKYRTEPIIQNDGTFFFENVNMIFEFLKYEGLHFLIINYELYTKLISMSNLTQDLYDLIEINICSLFDFTIEIFNQINFEVYIKEIKKLLFSIQKYVHLMSETSKLNGQLFVRLNKWLITLSTQNPDITSRSETFLLILRNQFGKFLLDSSLYNLKDYQTLEIIFYTFVNCITKKKEGLSNESVMRSLLQFADMYDDYDRTVEFKKVKLFFNEAITTFLKITEKVKNYGELHSTFFNKFDLGFKEYQMIQVFYLNAEYFYYNNDDRTKQKTSKYFIELYEYFDDKVKSKLTSKQKEIIRAICIRIILEFPLNDYFYFNDEKKRKTVRQLSANLEYAFKDSLPNTNQTEKLSYFPNSSGNSSNNSYEGSGGEDETKTLENYTSFDKVCDIIKKPSDYLIKSLILSIFDKDYLSADKKLHFLKKADDYTKFSNYDFAALTEFTAETRRMLMSLVPVIERNKEELGLTYQLFLYLALKIGRERKDPREGKENTCVFNHFLGSKKICGNIFIYNTYNIEACYLLQGEFFELVRLILPYHRSSFLFYFTKSVMFGKLEDSMKFFFLNLLIKFQHTNKNTKYYYYSQVALAQLLYEVFRDKRIKADNIQPIDHIGLLELFKSDLTKTRFNLLQNSPNCRRKKTYLEVIFDVLMKIIKYSKKKEDYEAIIKQIFVRENKENPIYANDALYFSSSYRSFHLNTMFKQYEKIKFASLNTHFLMKYLIYCISEKKLEFMSGNLVGLILDLSAKAFDNAKELFKDHSECRKASSKNSNLHNLVVDLVNHANKNSKVAYDHILYMFKENMIKESIDPKKMPEWFLNPATFEMTNAKEGLDNSFQSCSSTKSQKNRCTKKKATEKKKGLNQYLISNLKEEEPDLEIEQSHSALLDLTNITHSDEVVLFPKDSLLMKTFAIYFKDVFFDNEEFKAMKRYFKSQFEAFSVRDNSLEEASVRYPTSVKNFTPLGLFFKGLFLRHDLDFFHDTLFQYTHTYYLELLNKSAKYVKRLFPPKRKTELMAPIMKGEEGIPFYCELITNHCVIFGQIKIYNNFIYFENLNKDTESATLDEANKYLFLFCSDENDYSARPKRIHIFKKEIYQIFNRRFLYLFQACEIYLHNGKSYYFNFFTETKKSEFFEALENLKIEIIVDPKEDFRNKEYTKKWLSGQLSNLEYLLIINKNALRSYNDINQYPVVPWITLSLMKDRNFKFTTVAQTPKQQTYLSDKFSAIDRSFNSHYNTHFSNSSFVLYYLVRLNPFTNNQVNLQGNKLESPNRQFHSIAETLDILETSYDSRELIPEFFLTVEFFYNLNYVFFNRRARDNALVHHLLPINQMSPIDYIFYHKAKLNSLNSKTLLNHFIDNIFGYGQMKEQTFNIYEKYCYQGMISLPDKTQKYIASSMDSSQIKDKICKKINKIISFGQTPFKLLEDSHSVWVNEAEPKPVEDEMANSGGLDFSKLFQDKPKKQLNLNSKIYSITLVQTNKKPMLYAFVKLKKGDARYGIKLLETSFANDKAKPILIYKKINMLEKIKLTNAVYAYKYNPRYLMIDFQMNIFVIGRFIDNSFMIINQNGEMRCILTDSFVSCILKLTKRSFMTGHMDGRISEWVIKMGVDNSAQITDDMVHLHRSCLAQMSQVCAIYFDPALGIFITAGKEGVIYIRKYFDFCLLSVIETPNHFLFEIKLNCYFVYVLLYSETVNKYIVKVYSLNGFEIGKSDYEYFNSIDIDENSDIIAGLYTENKVKLLSASLKTITFFPLELNDKADTAKRTFSNFTYAGNKKIICVLSPDLLLKQTLTEKKENCFE